jgi:hypothetical protein
MIAFPFLKNISDFRAEHEPVTKGLSNLKLTGEIP